MQGSLVAISRDTETLWQRGVVPAHGDPVEMAAEWRFISLMLDCPEDGWMDRVETCARKLVEPELHAAVAAARRERNPFHYRQLFGPNGEVSLRESGYRKGADPDRLVTGLASQYAHQRFQASTSLPPDHIVVQTAFVAHLRGEEAGAWTHGDTVEATRWHEVAERFRRAHLDRFVGPLVGALRATGLLYLAYTADVLLLRGDPECERCSDASCWVGAAGCSRLRRVV
jgi:hypothetical protein